jgi:Ca-activated chloride channel family protein
MRRIMLAAAAAFAFFAPSVWAQTSPTAATSGAAGRAMIVLDASGSMWAPVGGRARIEVAREALGELLKGWDPKVEVGLMAYGHRRKNDCADIEVLAPAGPVDAARLTGIAARVTPQGMTPLSAAVKQAAEALKYTERRATVILISDGIETCQADPCALGAELKKLGIDFRAHVIGFAVQRQDEGGLRCLASATGGKYYSAGDAAQLRDALRAASQEAAAPPKPPAPPPATKPAPPKITLSAPKTVTAGDTLRVGWSGANAKTDTIGFTLPRNETVSGNSVDTAQNPASLRAPDKPGAYEIVYHDGGTGRIVARAPIEVTPAKATLEAVETITIGGTVEVAWTGPNNPGDFITIVPPTAAKDEYRDFSGTDGGSPAKVRVPDRPGTYEIRYVTGQQNEILARRTVVALAARVELVAQDQAPAGSFISVKWSGAPNNPGDFITVVRPDAEKGAYTEFFSPKDVDPETARLRLPPRPGLYEIRYVTAQTNEILARRPVIASATSATLDAPSSAPAGSRIKVAWTGPDNDGDFVTVVPVDAPKGEYTQYFNPKGLTPDDATLTLPTRPGNYEIRYVVAGSNETLARRPITVTAVQATLEVPPSAPAGARIRVKWTGPDNEGDYITAVRPDADRGAYTNYFNPRGMDPDDAKLVLPPAPGEYEVRYVTGGEARVLARARIRTEPFTIAIEAPDSVGAGKELEFKWTGPKLPENYFAIAKAGADADAYESAVGADGEDELRIVAPEKPGTYELRYVVPGLKRVLVRKTITVR